MYHPIISRYNLTVCLFGAEGKVVKELSKCDFGPIARYLDDLKEQKKEMSKDEKAAIKVARARNSSDT